VTLDFLLAGMSTISGDHPIKNSDSNPILVLNTLKDTDTISFKRFVLMPRTLTISDLSTSKSRLTIDTSNGNILESLKGQVVEKSKEERKVQVPF